MVRMRAFVFVLVTAVLGSAIPAFAQQDDTADATDIAGVYRCDGVNPSGKSYRGMVEIVRVHDTFQLRWTFPQGTDAALGIGILTNGVLAVSYYGGATAGVVVYKIAAGQPLVGEWTVLGSDGIFTETLTRVAGHEGGSGDAPKPERRQPPTLGDPSTIIQG